MIREIVGFFASGGASGKIAGVALGLGALAVVGMTIRGCMKDRDVSLVNLGQEMAGTKLENQALSQEQTRRETHGKLADEEATALVRRLEKLEQGTANEQELFHDQDWRDRFSEPNVNRGVERLRGKFQDALRDPLASARGLSDPGALPGDAP